jgi:Tetratricopeptide repeat
MPEFRFRRVRGIADMDRTRVSCSAILLAFGTIITSPAIAAQDADTSELGGLIDAGATPTGAVAAARTMAGAGDIAGAAATLERALLADPDANDVRLLYTAMLCRLDDTQGARVELARLSGQKTGDAAWADVTAACGTGLARPEPAAGAAKLFGGEVFAGLAFDSDALGPLATLLDFPGVPTPTQDGLSVIAGARLAGRASSFDGDGGLYGGISIRAKNSFDGPRQTYEFGDVSVGYGRGGAGTGYKVGAVVRHARLFGNPYVTEYGAQAEVSLASGEDRRVRLRGEAVHQDYHGVGPGVAGEGMRYDLSAALEGKTGGDGRYAVGVGAELKDGRVKDFGYVGVRAFAAAQWPVGDQGHYVNLSSTLRFIDFKDNPPVLDRKDTRIFARAAYGLPVSIDRLFVEAGVNYTARLINNRVTAAAPPPGIIGLADYDSVGAELRLVWKF